ncbi:MAG TPA: hypothetical protein VH092_18205 [Urbifossiella sp.]|nr:hypothetical protein [Urbifossiella sp.]
MTKADAVRAAVVEGKLKPQDAVQWIKEKFDIDIAPAHFSSYKSQQAKKEGTPTRRGRKPREAAPTPNGQHVGNGSPVELARQIKKLVDVYGVASVREMTSVFE